GRVELVLDATLHLLGGDRLDRDRVLVRETPYLFDLVLDLGDLGRRRRRRRRPAGGGGRAGRPGRRDTQLPDRRLGGRRAARRDRRHRTRSTGESRRRAGAVFGGTRNREQGENDEDRAGASPHGSRRRHTIATTATT